MIDELCKSEKFVLSPEDGYEYGLLWLFYVQIMFTTYKKW